MIGILGGTFDPPHNGHVALAKAALEQLPIDELVVLVDRASRAPRRRRGSRRRACGSLRRHSRRVSVRLDPNAFTVDAVRGGGFGEDALFVVGADQAAVFGRGRSRRRC